MWGGAGKGVVVLLDPCTGLSSARPYFGYWHFAFHLSKREKTTAEVHIPSVLRPRLRRGTYSLCLSFVNCGCSWGLETWSLPRGFIPSLTAVILVAQIWGGSHELLAEGEQSCSRKLCNVLDYITHGSFPLIEKLFVYILHS